MTERPTNGRAPELRPIEGGRPAVANDSSLPPGTAVARPPLRDARHGWLRPGEAYLFAIVATAATIGFRLAIDSSLDGKTTLVLFILPVMLSAHLGGARAGLLATALSILWGGYHLAGTAYGWRGVAGSSWWNLFFFAVSGVVISLLNEALHRARRRADLASRSHEEAERRLQAALKDTDDLRAALDQHAIVAATDPQGRITFVNDKFCAISQYSRDELLGKDHRIINSGHHSKEFIREIWQTIGTGRVWHGEIKNRAKDGSCYWVDTTIVPFLKVDGKPYQYVAIRADITERKLAEETIQRMNAELEERVAKRTAELEFANGELEAFSYSVSHDLRAPLRAVDGFSQAVLEDFGDQLPEEGRRYLRTIRLGAQQMGTLIDDLLTFSRFSRAPLNKQEVNTERLVRAVLDDLGPQKNGREIELRIGELPSCQADPALLREVWVNVLSNAVKYTRNRKDAVVEIGCDGSRGSQVFFVRDNGTGFDMQYADKLFGVFQRLHRAEDYEGTGVGLALVQRIIQRHGGKVWAEAEVDRGATFYFTTEGNHNL